MILLLVLQQGGVQFDVVPAKLSVGFDIRFPLTLDWTELESMMRGWCQDAGEGVVLDVVEKVGHYFALEKFLYILNKLMILHILVAS